MEGLAVLGLVALVVAAAEALVVRFGADSRDGHDWQPHRRREAACR